MELKKYLKRKKVIMGKIDQELKDLIVRELDYRNSKNLNNDFVGVGFPSFDEKEIFVLSNPIRLFSHVSLKAYKTNSQGYMWLNLVKRFYNIYKIFFIFIKLIN